MSRPGRGLRRPARPEKADSQAPQRPRSDQQTRPRPVSPPPPPHLSRHRRRQPPRGIARPIPRRMNWPPVSDNAIENRPSIRRRPRPPIASDLGTATRRDTASVLFYTRSFRRSETLRRQPRWLMSKSKTTTGGGVQASVTVARSRRPSSGPHNSGLKRPNPNCTGRRCLGGTKEQRRPFTEKTESPQPSKSGTWRTRPLLSFC